MVYTRYLLQVKCLEDPDFLVTKLTYSLSTLETSCLPSGSARGAEVRIHTSFSFDFLKLSSTLASGCCVLQYGCQPLQGPFLSLIQDISNPRLDFMQ